MSLRANFSIFTVIDIKLSFIGVNHVGNVVFKNPTYAVIHYVMTEVMTLSDESSKFIDVISNFCRLEHISCLGSACNMRTFLEFPWYCQIRRCRIRVVFGHCRIRQCRIRVVFWRCRFRRCRIRRVVFVSNSTYLETLVFQSVKILGTFFSTQFFDMKKMRF